MIIKFVQERSAAPSQSLQIPPTNSVPVLLKTGMTQKELTSAKDKRRRAMMTIQNRMGKEAQGLDLMENRGQDRDQSSQEVKAVPLQKMQRRQLQDIGLVVPELKPISFERNYNRLMLKRSSSPGVCGPWGGGKRMAMGDCFRLVHQLGSPLFASLETHFWPVRKPTFCQLVSPLLAS